MRNKFVAAAVSLCMTVVSIQTASADPTTDTTPAKSVNDVVDQIDREASVPAYESSVAFRRASGQTAAPGGNGAYVGIVVNGGGLNVTDVYVNYMPGTDIVGSNANAEEFEIAYYEHGERKVETQGPDSGFVRATQKWSLNRDIDPGPFCGRVKVDGEWSNYACIDIK